MIHRHYPVLVHELVENALRPAVKAKERRRRRVTWDNPRGALLRKFERQGTAKLARAFAASWRLLTKDLDTIHDLTARANDKATLQPVRTALAGFMLEVALAGVEFSLAQLEKIAMGVKLDAGSAGRYATNWAKANTDAADAVWASFNDLMLSVDAGIKYKVAFAVDGFINYDKRVRDYMRDPATSFLRAEFGPARAKRIIVTETTRAYAQGNYQAWRNHSGFAVGRWQWNTANDELVCPICGPRDGMDFSINADKELPPAHPNCRCWATPIIWDDAATSAAIFEELGLPRSDLPNFKPAGATNIAPPTGGGKLPNVNTDTVATDDDIGALSDEDFEAAMADWQDKASAEQAAAQAVYDAQVAAAEQAAGVVHAPAPSIQHADDVLPKPKPAGIGGKGPDTGPITYPPHVRPNARGGLTNVDEGLYGPPPRPVERPGWKPGAPEDYIKHQGYWDGDPWFRAMQRGGDLDTKILRDGVMSPFDGVRDYTGASYREINGALRKGAETVGPYQMESANEFAKAIDAALEHSYIQKDVTVFRGFSPNIGIQNMEVGQEFVDMAYLSTAASEQAAQGWGGVLGEIRLPAGQQARYVDPFSRNQGELEILLPRETRLRIVEKTEIPGLSPWDPPRTKVTFELSDPAWARGSEALWEGKSMRSQYKRRGRRQDPADKLPPPGGSDKFIWQPGDIVFLPAPGTDDGDDKEDNNG